MTDLMADIREFHEKYELQYAGLPRRLEPDLHDFRAKFLEEELTEYRESATSLHAIMTDEGHDPRAVVAHLEDQLDALVDLVYVAIGTAYLHGFDFNEAWARVHRANMSKVRVENVSDSKRGSTYDVVKPPGWKPPSHKDLVEYNAHSQGEFKL
jgi:predicted HAD superfamily Cof-like phosphohydrolase